MINKQRLREWKQKNFFALIFCVNIIKTKEVPTYALYHELHNIDSRNYFDVVPKTFLAVMKTF